MAEKNKLAVKDNLLKDMDFWNACGDVSEEWFDDIYEYSYVVAIHDEDFEGRKSLMEELSAPDNASGMYIYIVIGKKQDDYTVTLDVMFEDNNGKPLREDSYSIGENDNAYMVEQLRKHGVLARMEYELSVSPVKHSIAHGIER